MPTRDQEEKVGEVYLIGQTGGQRVTLEMVDRDKGLAGAPGHCLGHHRTNDQTAYQTRARGSGYSVDLGQRDIGLGECAVDDSIEMVEMRPCGDLGHDAAKRGMFGELRPELIR